MGEIYDDDAGRPFDWCEMQSSIVLQEQPTTAVYSNVHGHLVIRQQGPAFEDDPFVTIALENVEALIHALREEAEMLAHERERMAEKRCREEPPKALPAPEAPETGLFAEKSNGSAAE